MPLALEGHTGFHQVCGSHVMVCCAAEEAEVSMWRRLPMSVGACMLDETMSCVMKSPRIGNPVCCLACSLGEFGLMAIGSDILCAAVGHGEIHLSKKLCSTFCLYFLALSQALKKAFRLVDTEDNYSVFWKILLRYSQAIHPLHISALSLLFT